MAMLSKGYKPDNFKWHNSVKLRGLWGYQYLRSLFELLLNLNISLDYSLGEEEEEAWCVVATRLLFYQETFFSNRWKNGFRYPEVYSKPCQTVGWSVFRKLWLFDVKYFYKTLNLRSVIGFWTQHLHHYISYYNFHSKYYICGCFIYFTLFTVNVSFQIY